MVLKKNYIFLTNMGHDLEKHEGLDKQGLDKQGLGKHGIDIILI